MDYRQLFSDKVNEIKSRSATSPFAPKQESPSSEVYKSASWGKQSFAGHTPFSGGEKQVHQVHTGAVFSTKFELTERDMTP